MVIIAHRLSPDDLPGHLLREGGWRQIKLPLIAERDEEHPIDGGTWRRKKGDVLRPDAFDDEHIERLRRQATTPDFATLYQQAPAEASWQLVEDDFKMFRTTPPDAGGVVLSIDPAHVPGERNSFSVIQVWRSTRDGHYLIDQWRGQVTPNELERRVRIILNAQRPSVVLIEEAGAGIHLAERLSKRAMREGFIVEPISPGRRSKLARFSEVLPTIQAGSVYLPEHAPWRRELLDELLSFPDGKHDDQADALSQYLLWASMNPPAQIRPRRAVAYGRSATRIYGSGVPRPP
jgi:predicted phage terminase large subunit-like protein